MLEHMPEAVILRPSVIFGPEDAFFNRFAAMTRWGPALPVVGAETRFQPVYVDDVAQAAEHAVLGAVAPGVYELGGPEVMSFRALMQEMLKVIRRRRLILNIPFWAARPMAWGMELGQTLSIGLIPAQITQDQVTSLHSDNVVSGTSPGSKTSAFIQPRWRLCCLTTSGASALRGNTRRSRNRRATCAHIDRAPKAPAKLCCGVYKNGPLSKPEGLLLAMLS